MPSSTTILFVPGAWHSPQCFSGVGKLLKDDGGYDIKYVVLPSVGYGHKHKNFSQDVAKIRERIREAADAGQNIVLVCHSYGGVASSDAIKGYDLPSRQKEGQVGGVAHIVYCTSFLIPEGESLQSAFGGQDLPWYDVSSDQREVLCTSPSDVFYNDMSENEVEVAMSTLKPHSYQTFHSRLTYSAWKHVPSTYLYCEDDAAIPIHVQHMMVEQWAKGYNVRTETINASHSPFYSKPVETANAIRRAAELV